MMPNQNPGSACPRTMTMVTILSMSEPRYTAEMIPPGIATRMVMRMLAAARVSDAGKRSSTTWSAGRR